jgi:hydroxylaminobenzene mutase
MDTAQLQRTLARNAAVLLALGLVTGVLLSAAMTGKVSLDPRMVLSAHLNALLGCFWMVGVAATLPWTRFTLVGQSRLVWLVTVPSFANWLVTVFKSYWKVAGVDFVGESHNDIVFGLLTLLVVIPSFAAAGVWVYGLSGKRA